LDGREYVMEKLSREYKFVWAQKVDI